MELMKPETPAPPANPSDHLANERTFLAWIRTSIALMGFGFVVVKFSLFVKQLSLVMSVKDVLPAKGFSSTLGISMVGIGAATALIGYLRYRRIERQLLSKTYYPSSWVLALLTAGIIAVSLMLLWYLLPNA
jgi:putative membrane protein